MGKVSKVVELVQGRTQKGEEVASEEAREKEQQAMIQVVSATAAESMGAVLSVFLPSHRPKKNTQRKRKIEIVSETEARMLAVAEDTFQVARHRPNTCLLVEQKMSGKRNQTTKITRKTGE